MTWGLLGRLAERPVLRRVAWPVGAFLAVAAAGVTSFVLLADVGPVEALFWLVDPTSIELYFRDRAGPEGAVKAIAVFVAVGLVLCTVWAAESVLGALLGGQIGEEIRRAQEERRIMATEDHVIVCGYGMFGRTVARDLAEAGRDLVVVEVDEQEAERARQDEFLAVTGDARMEHVLRRAEIQDATTLVAAVDDSNVNIQVAIVADQIAPHLETTVRVGEEMYESLARRAGADHVVIPEIMSGATIASHIRAEAAPVEG